MSDNLTRVVPWSPSKYPDQFVPGDEITVDPIGKAVVIQSYATGNYHNNLGWALHVESPLGESVLSFTINSLSGMKGMQ